MEKSRKKMWIVMAVLLMACMVAAACNSSTKPSGSGGTQEGKKYRVACIVKSQSEIWASWLALSFQNHANDYDDMEVVLFDAQGDPALTIQHVETAVTEGYDAICVQKAAVFDTSELFTKVVKEDGIPIIGVNILTEDEVSFNVPAPQAALGRTMGEYAAENLPENAKVLVLRGNTNSLEQERYDAFVEACLDPRPDIQVLACEHANFRRDDAMKLMEDWYQLYPDFDAVLCLSDAMSTGVIEVLKGIPDFDFDSTQIYSIDGLPDGCLAVKEGKLECTVLQSADLEAQESLRLAHGILTGEIDKNDSQTILVPTQLITSENIDEYIQMHIDAGSLTEDAVAKIGK